jgi:hypothetical protein
VRTFEEAETHPAPDARGDQAPRHQGRAGAGNRPDLQRQTQHDFTASGMSAITTWFLSHRVSGRRAAHRLFGLWPGRTARGSGGRNNRHGIRMWNRSRLHYLRVHAFRWLDDTTAFIQFLAETLVSIRGRVSIRRASLGRARQILLWNCLITSRITRRNLRHGSFAS